MPAKKKPEPSKKAEQKKKEKEKVVKDKTFGIKNKKGTRNQKYIQQVQQLGNQTARNKKKEEKKSEFDELSSFFKPVSAQKVDKGVDPKSVLCAFYKQGQCAKGSKCKFSHDSGVERKSEKRNVYVDVRDEEEDNMENWDEEKLKEVIEKKHGEEEKRVPKTDIVCKHFLDALENNKYGWFWECPNNDNRCHYRHALPQGFVLRKDDRKQIKKEEVSIEDLVEKQRAQLGHNLTHITFETFHAWKKKKFFEKEEKSKKEERRKKAEFKIGKSAGLTGREMFTLRPELVFEDALEEGETAFDVRTAELGENDSGDEIKKVIEDEVAVPLDNIGDTGTVASMRHWQNEEVSLGNRDGDFRESEDVVLFDEDLFQDDLDDLVEELEELGI